MSKQKKVLYTIMTVFYIFMFTMLALPFGTNITDKVEPHFLGLPCYQAWVLYGSLLMAFGLIVWFLLDCRIEDKEAEAELTTRGGDEA